MNSKRFKILAYFQEFDNLPTKKIFGFGDSPDDMLDFLSKLYGQEVTVKAGHRYYRGVLMDPHKAIADGYTWDGRDIIFPEYLIFVVTDESKKRGSSISHFSPIQYTFIIDLDQKTIVVQTRFSKEEYERQEDSEGLNKKAYFEEAIDGINITEALYPPKKFITKHVPAAPEAMEYLRQLYGKEVKIFWESSNYNGKLIAPAEINSSLKYKTSEDGYVFDNVPATAIFILQNPETMASIYIGELRDFSSVFIDVPNNTIRLYN